MKKTKKLEQKSYIKEFFGLFGKKKSERKKDINDLIDNDPVLKKLDAEINDINSKAEDRLEKIATSDQMAILRKYGVIK
jgi:hypothetical protein